MSVVEPEGQLSVLAMLLALLSTVVQYPSG